MQPRSHGNATSKLGAYTTTKTSPATAVSRAKAEAGGFILPNGPADLCRNAKQAHNIKQKGKGNFQPLKFGWAEVIKRRKSEMDGRRVREGGSLRPRVTLCLGK